MAIVGFRLSRQPWLAVVFLALGGAALFVLAVFRGTILQAAASDEMRGRMQGALAVVAAGGPWVADIVHGTIGAAVGTTLAISGGGVLAVVVMLAAALAFPALWRYRASGSDNTDDQAQGQNRQCCSPAATVGLMRIATWNVNSVKQRVPRLLPWLDQRQPDVVCLQETKLADDAFTELLGEDLASRGYAVALHGEAQWNGVAILSKVGLDDVVAGVAGAPGFPRPEARAVSATCDGIRVYSVYVPNGRVPDSDHYQYKLAWLAALRDEVAAVPEAAIVCGDMNIAPTDADVFDPDAYIGQTHVTPPERAALAELQALGLRDVVRDRWPAERVFTYWDYRAGMFHRDLGMRIDLVLASASVAGRVRAAWVDRQARKGSGPSDHAPVIVDLDEAPDGDIGPVVPPPSAPSAKRGSAKLPQSRSQR